MTATKIDRGRKGPCPHGERRRSYCVQCRREKGRRLWRSNPNYRIKNRAWVRAHPGKAKIYEKTPRGFLVRAYRNMLSRVTGVQKKKAHLYLGKSILPREAFYAWARDNVDFWRLYRRWVESGYSRKLSPSVNRIDADLGYDLGNIEWLTHSANSGLSRQPPRRALERLYASI